MRLGTTISLILLGILSALTSAQQTQPASPESPKGALRQLNLALRDGNAQTVRQLIHTGSDDEAKLVAAMADYSAALASLHKEASKAFGEAGANAVTGDAQAESAEGLAAIEKAEVKTEGDTAAVNYPLDESKMLKTVQLVKIDGVWKLPLAQLVVGADADAQRKRLEELNRQTDLAKQTADEIAGRKYKLANQAAHAWRGRLLDAVLASALQKKGE